VRAVAGVVVQGAADGLDSGDIAVLLCCEMALSFAVSFAEWEWVRMLVGLHAETWEEGEREWHGLPRSAGSERRSAQAFVGRRLQLRRTQL